MQLRKSAKLMSEKNYLCLANFKMHYWLNQSQYGFQIETQTRLSLIVLFVCATTVTANDVFDKTMLVQFKVVKIMDNSISRIM